MILALVHEDITLNSNTLNSVLQLHVKTSIYISGCSYSKTSPFTTRMRMRVYCRNNHEQSQQIQYSLANIFIISMSRLIKCNIFNCKANFYQNFINLIVITLKISSKLIWQILIQQIQNFELYSSE